MDVQKEISVLSDDEINNYLKDNNNIAVYTNIEPDDAQLQNYGYSKHVAKCI